MDKKAHDAKHNTTEKMLARNARLVSTNDTILMRLTVGERLYLEEIVAKSPTLDPAASR
jgi:hypothetical protein